MLADELARKLRELDAKRIHDTGDLHEVGYTRDVERQMERLLWHNLDTIIAALRSANDRSALVAADQFLCRKVSKRGGDYEFDGEIRAVVVKRSGAARYVVEDDRGLLLIMNGKQCGLEQGNG